MKKRDTLTCEGYISEMHEDSGLGQKAKYRNMGSMRCLHPLGTPRGKVSWKKLELCCPPSVFDKVLTVRCEQGAEESELCVEVSSPDSRTFWNSKRRSQLLVKMHSARLRTHFR